jgi:hypothetical protein
MNKTVPIFAQVRNNRSARRVRLEPVILVIEGIGAVVLEGWVFANQVHVRFARFEPVEALKVGFVLEARDVREHQPLRVRDPERFEVTRWRAWSLVRCNPCAVIDLEALQVLDGFRQCDRRLERLEQSRLLVGVPELIAAGAVLRHLKQNPWQLGCLTGFNCTMRYRQRNAFFVC